MSTVNDKNEKWWCSMPNYYAALILSDHFRLRVSEYCALAYVNDSILCHFLIASRCKAINNGSTGDQNML